MVIIIYSNAQVKDFAKTKEQEEQIEKNCQQPTTNSLKNDACITANATSSNTAQKISLNTATLEELLTLPGIGEAKAKDIIEYRKSNGNFKTIEDIMKIPGIGESVFAKIKDYLTI